MARDGDVAMLGPNCLGYTNFVDGFTAGFAHAAVVPKVASARDPALAMVSQSGGFMAHLRQAFEGRNLPTSYTISPGNEAGLDLVDFIDFFTVDKATSASCSTPSTSAGPRHSWPPPNARVAPASRSS